MRAVGRRRSFALAIPALATALAAASLLGGCGGGGGGDHTVSGESSADAEILNVALSQELTIIDVYSHGVPLLDARSRAIVRQFRAQEQEHVNGITKALRGLQGSAEGEAEEVDLSDVKNEDEFLPLIYEMTGNQVKHYVDDTAHLATVAPRTLAATFAANEAQHLVVLRQLLGAGLAASVPEGFDVGQVPPPVEEAPSGKG